jgi:hypothetical protein
MDSRRPGTSTPRWSTGHPSPAPSGYASLRCRRKRPPSSRRSCARWCPRRARSRRDLPRHRETFADQVTRICGGCCALTVQRLRTGRLPSGPEDARTGEPGWGKGAVPGCTTPVPERNDLAGPARASRRANTRHQAPDRAGTSIAGGTGRGIHPMTSGRSARRQDLARRRPGKAGRRSARIDLAVAVLIGMARYRVRKIDFFIDYFGEHRLGRPPLPATS